MRSSLFSALAVCLLLASCSQNNVTEDNSLKKYFDDAGVSGNFGLFDNGQGSFIIYNLARFRDSAFLPATTFDLVQSLIGIQTGVVKDENAVIVTDSSKAATDTAAAAGNRTAASGCNGSQTLQQAFQNDCVNASVALEKRIGKDTLRKWIDSLGYGNKDINGPIDSFWLDNHLTLTSDEQLGLVKKLYFDQLPFFQHTQQLVRKMMLRESNTNYQLSYKTGSGIGKNGQAIGWLQGWIEENKHVYFFVINMATPDKQKDLPAAGLTILKGILQQNGFFQGKK